MRVAINALWRATAPSGICRHAAALVRCLSLRADVERIYLFIGSWQQQYFRQGFQLSHRKLAVRTIEIANHASARNLWYICGLPKLVDQVGAHITHLSFPVPLNRQHLRMPVVTTLHDLYPYDAPSNFGFPRVLGHRILLRQCLHRSDGIACVSDFTLSRLAALFGTDISGKAVRIYNCVEPPYVRDRRPMVNNLNGRPFLLSVAQHRKNKNIELLLEGLAILLGDGIVSQDTALIIVGSRGPETPTLVRAIARLNLQDHVILMHGVSDAELAWLYQNTDLTLCTSSLEGFGLPLAEAIYYGARVVCSDIPPFREIGGDNCTFFSLSGEPLHNLVQACECALRESAKPLYRNSIFSAETIAAQYMSLYSQLLHSGLPQAA